MDPLIGPYFPVFLFSAVWPCEDMLGLFVMVPGALICGVLGERWAGVCGKVECTGVLGGMEVLQRIVVRCPRERGWGVAMILWRSPRRISVVGE